MPDAVFVAGPMPESRRSSATRDAPERPSNGNGNGNGHALADEGLLATDPLELSSGSSSRDPARRAAIEMASAVMIASSAETAAHADDVDVISEAICRRVGLSPSECEEVVL